MSRIHSAAAIRVFAAAVSTIPLAARAEGFDARPITIETRDGLGSIVVTNPGDRRIYLQTQVFDWSQDNSGRDILTESKGAIASPPAMWVGPYTTYNLRVRLLPGPPGQERAFRVVIKQLPDWSNAFAGRLAVALSQSLPAFVEPAEVSPPALNARFTDTRHILISNAGGRRARLANITQDGQVIAPGLVGYALSRSALAVSLPNPVHPGTIEIDTDTGSRALNLQ